MQKTDEELLVIWREKIATLGIAAVRANADSLEKLANGRDYYVSRAAIAEYEENQASERHREQLELGQETRDLQKTGNTIQWWILAVLVVAPIITIIVTIALARGAELP